MEKQKMIGLASAGIAIVFLVLAAFSNSWVVGHEYNAEIKVGLRSVEVCTQSGCETESMAQWSKGWTNPGEIGTFVTLGAISFWLALVTALTLVVLVGFTLAKSLPPLPMHPGTLALLLSVALLLVGVLTLSLHPFKHVGWGTGPGFMLMAAGDVGALIGGLFLGRSSSASDDEEWFE